jgi:hypothetical protein
MTTNPQKVFNLLCQAELFGVKELKERSEQILLEYVDEDNVVLLLENSDKFNALKLKETSIAFVLRNYEQIYSTEEYKSLPQHLQEEINNNRERLGNKK